jgi:chemotaxis protein histidine kinase CheA
VIACGVGCGPTSGTSKPANGSLKPGKPSSTTCCHANGHSFDLAYKPLAAGAPSSRTLVVITDVTAILARERAEEQQKELVTIVERFHRDRTSVRHFFEEAEGIVATLCQHQDDPTTTARLLHTLKGTCAMFGLPGVARLCHGLEEDLADGTGLLDRAAREQLATRWQEVEDRFSIILADKGGKRFEVDEDRHARVVAAVAASAPRERVEHLLKLCRYEPVVHRLEHLAEQTSRLAERMQKQPLRVIIEANDLLLGPGVLSEVWNTSIHILRNAVDHGIETREERLERGKPAAAEIMLVARLSGGVFELEFQDRGRGIDWDLLRAHAVRLGLPAATDQDLTNVLFRDGFSTKDVVTEISGRGLGMSAVKTACEQSGGRIQVSSERDRGTTVRLSWPTGTIDAIVSDETATPAGPRVGEGAPSPDAAAAGSVTGAPSSLRLRLATDSDTDAELKSFAT